ncbi:MAG TPA: dihydrolipoamide acetyltransferase family protein [Candidatus Sulfotelmatobacter sp.]|nr:dihydrolipoamide acetyltransferase family protein [Candidatus Sulfotelmatobacter sp.]
MARLLEMPEIAESVVEGEVVRWMVKEGDRIQRDQPFAEVMTDKVTVELPSPYEGTLLKIVAREGQVVPVGKPLGVLGEAGEQVDLAALLGGAHAAPAPAAAGTPAQPGGAGGDGADRVKAVPSIRKMAHDLGLDITRVQGTGPEGRITREDVLKAAEAQASRGGPAAPAAPRPSARPTARAAAPAAAAGAGPVERVPLRGVRRAVAERLSVSKRTAVHTLHVDEVDATNLVGVRERVKGLARERGIKLTYLPFICKAAVMALKKVPAVNASIDDKAGEIVYKRYYNFGIAVHTPDGLIAPVVKAVDRKTLFAIAGEIAALAEKARTGTLALGDVQDSTFSITNVGSTGGLFSFPVINYPDVAILGVHRIRQIPRVVDGRIAIRDVMLVSLAFDHRLIDGAVAGEFTNELKRILEAPELLLLESA